MTSPKIKRKFIEFKPEVIALRKRGRTYGEIRQIYSIPKSTLSNWLMNVKIPKEAKKIMQKRVYKKWRINNEIFIKKGIEDAKKIRLAFQAKAANEIKKVSPSDLKFIGTALFWAEGNKKHRSCLRFSNSDPEIIKVIMKFFQEVCKINKTKIKARVHIYPDMDYSGVLSFWARITKLPKNNFYKPKTQISRASKRKRNTLPYGTLHLNAGNTESMCKIKGWIQGIAEKINFKIN